MAVLTNAIVDNVNYTIGASLIHKTGVVLNDTTAVTGGYSTTVSDSRITEDMRVVNANFIGAQNLLTDISWVTSNGQVVFTYDIEVGTTATMEFDLIYTIT